MHFASFAVYAVRGEQRQYQFRTHVLVSNVLKKKLFGPRNRDLQFSHGPSIAFCSTSRPSPLPLPSPLLPPRLRPPLPNQPSPAHSHRGLPFIAIAIGIKVFAINRDDVSWNPEWPFIAIDRPPSPAPLPAPSPASPPTPLAAPSTARGGVSGVVDVAGEERGD